MLSGTALESALASRTGEVLGGVPHPFGVWAIPLLVSTGAMAYTHVLGLVLNAPLMSFLKSQGCLLCGASPPHSPALVFSPIHLPLDQLASSWWLVSQLPGCSLALSTPDSPTKRSFAFAFPSAGNVIPLALGLAASDLSPFLPGSPKLSAARAPLLALNQHAATLHNRT